MHAITETLAGEQTFDGGGVCLHFLMGGRAIVERARYVHRLCEDAYLIQNMGTPHMLRVENGRVLSIQLTDLANQRFAECLAPHDEGMHRSVSQLVLGQGGLNSVWAALLAARTHSREQFYLAEARNDRMMRLAREFVLTQLHRPIRLHEIAACCGYSAFHFHRRFHEFHGISPGAYVIREKVRRACRRLVLGEDKVAKVARDCGFASTTAFIGRFQESTGYSPGDFRKTVAAAARPHLQVFLQ